MKKLNLILLLITLSLCICDKIHADILQDALDKFTNISRKTTHKPMATKSESDNLKKDKNLTVEDAQKLAKKASIRATEAANTTVTAVKNVALHLENLKRIYEAAELLNNVSTGRGNSLEETAKAKQLLHNALPDSRKLIFYAQQIHKQLEKTLRATANLDKNLHGTSTILNNPTLSKIWDTLKNAPTNIS